MVFEDGVGISLLSPLVSTVHGERTALPESASIIVEPRSVYVLRSLARTEWEPSISAVKRPRSCITFRTLRSEEHYASLGGWSGARHDEVFVLISR